MACFLKHQITIATGGKDVQIVSEKNSARRYAESVSMMQTNPCLLLMRTRFGQI